MEYEIGEVFEDGGVTLIVTVGDCTGCFYDKPEGCRKLTCMDTITKQFTEIHFEEVQP